MRDVLRFMMAFGDGTAAGCGAPCYLSDRRRTRQLRAWRQIGGERAPGARTRLPQLLQPDGLDQRCPARDVVLDEGAERGGRHRGRRLHPDSEKLLGDIGVLRGAGAIALEFVEAT